MQTSPLIGSFLVSSRVCLSQGAPTPLQGGAFGDPRAQSGQLSYAPNPCRIPYLCCLPRVRVMKCLPAVCPSLMAGGRAAMVSSPSSPALDKPGPPLTSREGSSCHLRALPRGLILVDSPNKLQTSYRQTFYRSSLEFRIKPLATFVSRKGTHPSLLVTFFADYRLIIDFRPWSQ